MRFTAFGGSPEATHGVDVTESFDAGVHSLECHRMYLDNLGGDMASPDEFLRGAAVEVVWRSTPVAPTSSDSVHRLSE